MTGGSLRARAGSSVAQSERKTMERKWLYEVMYNNVLLPRRREIDREEEREAFDGTTESLVKLYRENQITYEGFTKMPEAEIQRIIDKSKDLEISKKRFFQLVNLF